MQCPACAAVIPAESRFCLACGRPLGTPSEFATIAAVPEAVAVAGPHVRRLASSDSVPVGGFTPGTILTDRYRIIGLLGRGGMGEVYRADDLKLGQPVALKFLPRALAADPVRRERFFAEVRITRQLSHPNICRVYDIAEVNGQHFLSMEYIDGEDLASLLQRIGYLPQEKANDIARQLAAGLAAAHDRGVLHRDLKPANIMLDGQGRVRITDFGLAVAIQDDAAAEVSGTPAYMAPEQLAGKGATVRSDIYALGLVLYELYTGRKAFTEATLAELRDAKENTNPREPAELREGIDPVVARLIVRCIERDPRQRPASASQLAAALPGGDPLAAAIAAGETPSPEMVAAAGETDGMSVRAVVACAGLIVIALPSALTLMARTNPLLAPPLPRPPEVLVATAQDLRNRLGYTAAPFDNAYGFETDADAAEQRNRRSAVPPSDFTTPPVVRFWYRESPGALFAARSATSLGVVSRSDPPAITSGMIGLTLDPDGGLLRFDAVPPERESGAAAAPMVNWRPAFDAARLDLSQFTPAEPEWLSLGGADQRFAWISGEVRVEAAAWHGRPVYFQVIHGWTRPARLVASSQSPRLAPAVRWLLLAIALTVLTLVFALVRHNLRKRRADLHGATRLALVVCALELTRELLVSPLRAGDAQTPFAIFVVLPFALLYAFVTWVAYVAVEPHVRRRWPEFMISWTRLLSGRVRDPLVGSHVLSGILVGLVLTGLGSIDGHQPIATGLMGTGAAIGEVLRLGRQVMLVASLQVLIFFALRLLLRRAWLAAMAFSVVPAAMNGVLRAGGIVPAALLILAGLLFALILVRFGVLTIVIALFTIYVLKQLPITTDLSAWYADSTWVAIVVILSLTAFACRTALAGRPVFRSGLLDAD